MFALGGKRVFVAGHRGMVGGAIMRRLADEGCQILTATRGEVDLTDQAATHAWMARHRPEAVFVAAAKVGGIMANRQAPADFLYQNLMIEANLIEASRQAGVEKLLFLGSACIYPEFADQPIREDALLTGPLEANMAWYAVAKIAGIKLCQAYRRQHGVDYISCMPTNLYGPGDNYDLTTSHVIPALIRKVHLAKQNRGPVEVWGTGTPMRDFMHADDCADACVHLMKAYSGESHVNIGFGRDISILDLTRLVMEVIGYDGPIVMDPTKPDGTARKLMDATLLHALGWAPRISLREGLADAYRHFLREVG